MKTLFHILFFFAGINVAAQPSLSVGNLLSGNQQLIEDAVKDGIFIVRRCYQLQDITAQTPTYFGWQNLNWFGETYSLGIKVKVDGYYLFDKAVRPWVYDSKFEQYAGSDRYAPTLSASEYRTLNDSSYQAMQYKDIMIKETSAQHVYLAHDSTLFQQKGFTIDYNDGLKKGWLVWLVADKPLEEQKGQIPPFLIYRSELTFEREKERYEIRDPATNRHILGGFYFLPEITDVGQINFYLSGVLHNENGAWQVVRINNPENIRATQPQSVQSGLTPINIQTTDNLE